MLNNTWTQISVTCQLFPIKLLCRLRQLEDDCDSEIAMALSPSLHINWRFCQEGQQPLHFCLSCPAWLAGDFGSSKEERKRGEGIMCSVCPLLSVSGAFKWTVIPPPLFKSLGEISTCSRVHIVPFIFCPLLFCITTGRGSCTVAAGCNRDYICMLHCLNLCTGSYLRCQ